MAVYSHRTIRTNAIPRTGRLQDALSPASGSTIIIGGSGGTTPSTGDIDISAGKGIDVSRQSGEAVHFVISHKDTSFVKDTSNTDDYFVQNIQFDEFGHVIGVDNVRVSSALDDRYLRKDIDDTAHGNITFDQSISSTVYLEGFDGKGWKIENTGLAEFDGARIRSDVFLGGKIGSPSFASGFTGWGWEIDTPTASGTVDNWTVRKTFKVYEMIYSQVLGLNGSSMITDFVKIKAVSPLGTGRYHCTMDDVDGEMMMNLRNGDIVRAQKRDGWNIRFYYALVENVTSNSFDLKILSGSDVPEPGDVCFRTGNEKDKNRQGLIYLTSSDDYASYIDILDEIDGPSFEGKTKVRLGNLRGLTVNGQPLDMYGIYINGGIFQHSSYYLDNGNTIEQQFTIMDGKLESSIEAIRNDMSVENGNILRNSGFSTDMNYWESTNNVHFIPVGGGFLWLPSAFYVEKESVADIYRDGSRNVLRIKNCSIRQLNSVLNLPGSTREEVVSKQYSFAFYYRVLRAGTLTAGFSGSDLYVSLALEPSDNYQKLTKIAGWDEKGDFVISFTGEILIYAVSLFNDALADAVVKLETRIEQTEEYIKLLATKEYVDKGFTAVNEAIEEANTQIGDTKNSLNDLQNDVDSLANFTDTTFSDGIIDFSEAAAIEKYINTVDETKKSAEATYNKLYANAYLTGQAKTDLLNAKISFFGAVDSLLEAINTAIKDKKTTAAEKQAVDAAFVVFNESYASLMTAIEAANKAIQDYIKQYVDSENETIKQSFESALTITAENISAVSQKVDNINQTIETAGWITSTQGNEWYAKKAMESGDTIISTINQTPEAVTINANKINLNGVVTFSMFSEELQTTVNDKEDKSNLKKLAYKDLITTEDVNQEFATFLGNLVNSDSLAQALKLYATSSSLQTVATDSANAVQAVKDAMVNGDTEIIGGFISTKLLDVDNLYCTSLAAVRGSIAKFRINSDNLYISNSNIYAGFGLNSAPSTLGINVPLWVENQKTNQDTNVACYLKASGAISNNIALYAEGRIAVRGSVIASSYTELINPGRGNPNVLDIRKGNVIYLHSEGIYSDQVYLPSRATVCEALGWSRDAPDYFAVRLTIIPGDWGKAKYTIFPPSGMVLFNKDGAEVDYIQLAENQVRDFIINGRDTYYAYILS